MDSYKKGKNMNNYRNPVGLWQVTAVTTEGDCECRTTRELGIYKGHVVDIAKNLGKQSFYKLTFHTVSSVIFKSDPVEIPKKVSIGFDIDSGTWDMSGEERKQFFADLFEDRDDVSVETSKYHASVVLDFSSEVERREKMRVEALNKLTPEERKLLGL